MQPTLTNIVVNVFSELYLEYKKEQSGKRLIVDPVNTATTILYVTECCHD